MTITKEQRDAIEMLPNWEDTYTAEDGYDAPDAPDEDSEDDCFIHIRRSGLRFVFYNGQDKYALGERDVKKYAKMVDTILGGK